MNEVLFWKLYQLNTVVTNFETSDNICMQCSTDYNKAAIESK